MNVFQDFPNNPLVVKRSKRGNCAERRMQGQHTFVFVHSGSHFANFRFEPRRCASPLVESLAVMLKRRRRTARTNVRRLTLRLMVGGYSDTAHDRSWKDELEVSFGPLKSRLQRGGCIWYAFNPSAKKHRRRSVSAPYHSFPSFASPTHHQVGHQSTPITMVSPETSENIQLG